MSNTRRLGRQILTIARRDFVATVFTPTFLIFLLAPLLMGSFSLIGGLGASAAADGSRHRVRIVAIAGGEEAEALARVDRALRSVFRPDDAPPALRIDAPSADPARQARALFDDQRTEVSAAIYGPLDRPQILFTPDGPRTADYLAELAEQVMRDRVAGGHTLSTATREKVMRASSSQSARTASGFFATTAIFVLTLLLASQAAGSLADERSNKVIEVLAAAVPLEAVFFGKLVGLFGIATVFVLFWGTLLGQVTALVPPDTAASLRELTPAIGMPTFMALFFVYLTMAYMLLAAVFLSIGARAATMREVQMLSLPMTIIQMLIFGLALAAAGKPGTGLALFAEVFPLSSPFAMAARAASDPGILRHLAAIAWQALWVGLTVTIGARAFRRGVLQSGNAAPGWLARLKRA